MSRSETYRKLVLVPAADYCSLVGIFSDPDNPFGVHKDFQAVHIFKHYKLHVASFWQSPGAPLQEFKITKRFGRLYRCRNFNKQKKKDGRFRPSLVVVLKAELVSNFSWCPAGSLFTMIVRLVSSSISFSSRALFDFNSFATSGCTR